MKNHLADNILRRMESQATLLDQEGRAGFTDCRYPNEPRWKLESRWIEFECGCRAERITKFAAPVKLSDPIIFRDLPEQAVYDYVCAKHEPKMNFYISYQGFRDFAQWKLHRRATIMGKR